MTMHKAVTDLRSTPPAPARPVTVSFRCTPEQRAELGRLADEARRPLSVFLGTVVTGLLMEGAAAKN